MPVGSMHTFVSPVRWVRVGNGIFEVEVEGGDVVLVTRRVVDWLPAPLDRLLQAYDKEGEIGNVPK